VAFDSASWIKRADEILATGGTDERTAREAIQFATSMLTALYGPKSPQLQAFTAGCSAIEGRKVGIIAAELRRCACGVIANAKAELQAGLIGNLRLCVTGEVLADLVSLGKETIGLGNEVAKNVAAVVIAAAYEDLIRRMGIEFAQVPGRPDLQEVIARLKDAGTLKGGEIGIAQSFLKFRNDSLHADWANASRAQVESCIAFIDAMLMKHFS
jgi:hypothetical protein